MAVSLGMLPGAVLKIHLLLGVYLEDKGNVARWKQSTIILRPFSVKNKRKNRKKKLFDQLLCDDTKLSATLGICGDTKTCSDCSTVALTA